jgi:hypothetical protein
MMNNLDILWQNKNFVMDAYGISGLLGVLGVLAVIDLILKGWALWRAARMEKKWWFIALLLVNSVGIFPTIFLFFTNEEYERTVVRKKVA